MMSEGYNHRSFPGHAAKEGFYGGRICSMAGLFFGLLSSSEFTSHALD